MVACTFDTPEFFRSPVPKNVTNTDCPDGPRSTGNRTAGTRRPAFDYRDRCLSAVCSHADCSGGGDGRARRREDSRSERGHLYRGPRRRAASRGKDHLRGARSRSGGKQEIHLVGRYIKELPEPQGLADRGRRPLFRPAPQVGESRWHRLGWTANPVPYALPMLSGASRGPMLVAADVMVTLTASAGLIGGVDASIDSRNLISCGPLRRILQRVVSGRSSRAVSDNRHHLIQRCGRAVVKESLGKREYRQQGRRYESVGADGRRSVLPDLVERCRIERADAPQFGD